jgi:hypothetical protein
MTEIVGEIALILGMGRDGKVFEKRRRKPGREQLERDTVSISTEARRLLAGNGNEAAASDEARVNESVVTLEGI